MDKMIDAMGTQGFEHEPNADPCGDGLQTPLNSMQHQAQKNAWCEGLDFDYHRLDDFNKACFVGNLKQVLGKLAIPVGSEVMVTGVKSKSELNGQVGKVTQYVTKTNRYSVAVPSQAKDFAFKTTNVLVKDEEDKYVPWLHCKRARGPTTYELMETRQSQMRFSALLCTVRGSKVIVGPPGHVLGHKDVIDTLLAHGAMLEARDVAGYTPLRHALSCPNSEASRALGEQLLGQGADINSQTRFGAPAIHESIMGSDKETFVFLMDHGAKLDLNDSDGCNPASNTLVCKPWFAKEILRRQRKDRSQQEKEQPCGNPACAEKGGKRCARCEQVRYCCAECQRAHWKEHKAECGKAMEECVVPLRSDMAFTTMSLNGRKDKSGNFKDNQAGAAHPHQERFKVKVQVPVDGSLGPMMVYDKARSFTLQLMPSTPNAPRVHAMVRKGGVIGGLKGFFYAYVTGSKSKANLHIIIQDPLPKACTW